MQNIDMPVHDTGFSSTGSITAHNHEGTGLYEFHYFLAGEERFWNAGLESAVKPGTIFFSAPEEVHQARASQASGKFLFYYLLFTGGDSDDLLGAIRSKFAGQSSAFIGRSQAPAFEDIRRRCSSAQALVRRSADYRFLALLCDLAGNGPSPVMPAGKYIDEALLMMQASIHLPLNLGTVAQRLGIDKSYFVRLFTKSVGQPPMRYFLGLRLDTAKHRLQNGDESLRTIALDLGFHDEFHFSHQFKAHVGQSPQSFRHNRG